MEALLDYIAQCPTAFHTAGHSAALLEAAGYTRLAETEEWQLTPGGKYYVMRNGSSVIAFRLPEGPVARLMMAAAHTDSPSFKLNEDPQFSGVGVERLSVEKYGGSIYATWLDRPLSIAGRVLVRTEGGVETRLVDLRQPCAVIPNVAIHMNRQMNEKNALNPAVDLVPVYGLEGCGSLKERIAAAAGAEEKDILGDDLFLYNPQRGVCWNGLVSAPRLDDLQCAYATLRALLEAEPAAGTAAVCCLFDNEEVGSQTKQGAAAPFLRSVAERIAAWSGERDLTAWLANSFMASCDNAHAQHPNHPELADSRHAPRMGGGVVIKHNAAQHYTTDGVSDAIFRLVCEKAGVAVQHYNNRPDMAGGSTLGNIANTQVALNTVDVGCAQLAMHSAWETAAASDTDAMVKALTALYETALVSDGKGGYRV